MSLEYSFNDDMDLDELDLFTNEEIGNQSMDFLYSTFPSQSIHNQSLQDRNHTLSNTPISKQVFSNSTPMSFGQNYYETPQSMHQGSSHNAQSSTLHENSHIQHTNENTYSNEMPSLSSTSEVQSQGFPSPQYMNQNIQSQQYFQHRQSNQQDISQHLNSGPNNFMQFSFGLGLDDHSFANFEPITPDQYGYLDTTFDFNPSSQFVQDGILDMEGDEIEDISSSKLASINPLKDDLSGELTPQFFSHDILQSAPVMKSDVFQLRNVNNNINNNNYNGMMNTIEIREDILNQSNQGSSKNFSTSVYRPNSQGHVMQQTSGHSLHNINTMNAILNQQNLNQMQGNLTFSRNDIIPTTSAGEEKRTFDILCASVGPSERNRKGKNHLFTEDDVHFLPMIKKDKNVRFKVELHPDSVFCKANSTLFTKKSAFVHEIGVLYVQHCSMAYRSGTKTKWVNVSSDRWNVNEIAPPTLMKEDNSTFLTFELNFPNSQREMGVKTNKNVYRFEFLLSLRQSENHPVRLASVYFIYKIDSNGKKLKCVVNQLATSFVRDRGYIYQVFDQNNEVSLVAFDEFHHIHFSESMDQGVYSAA